MTGKRFVYCFEGIEDTWETDEEYKYTPCTKDGFQDLCEMLNELHEEKEQLKMELEVCRNNKLFSRRELERENKELKEILKHTYEIHECETCKHNENFNWLDPATMNREYDSRCSKGLHYGDEVHDCEEYELDLEMFKKRVKR